MDHAAQDGIGDGGIEKPYVPVFDRDLSGHQGRFVLSNVPSGECWISIRAPGGGGMTRPVKVVGHQATDIGTAKVYAR